MHSSVQRARTARLLSDRANLERVCAQLASAEHEHSVALEKAANLAVEVQQLQQQKNFLTSSVGECCTAFSREFFTTCPEELLCYIFELLSNDSSDAKQWSIMCGGYEGHRARMPFIISAVCVRWRKIALARSSLWTYIGLPIPSTRNFDGMLDAQRSRVDLLLSRSGLAPLEVLLPWDDVIFDNPELDAGQGCLRANARQAAKMRGIFTAISGHINRWGRASLWIPHAFDMTLLYVLRGPTPALTELAIICNAGDDWNSRRPLTGFFPFAPQLKQLRLCNTGMLCSTVAAFPALSSLELGPQFSCHWLSNFLTRCASTLEYLEIALCPPENDGSIPHVQLPRLHSLQVGSVPYFVSSSSSPAFLAPCLRDLTLNSPAIKADIVPFLQKVTTTVTHLTLHGNISGSHLQVLAPLANLTHFAMAVYDYGNMKYTIDDDFFAELARDDPGAVVWTKLRSISLRKGGSISNENDADGNEGVGILRLVSQRNAIERPQGDGRPCKLEEVVLRYDAVPAWLVAEVARLLSA